MGTAGTGRMGDYDIRRTVRSNTSGDGGSGSGSENTLAKHTNTDLDLLIKLEDVPTSEYYITTESLPPVGSPVYIDTELHEKRMVVRDRETGMIIGNLPTRLHTKFKNALLLDESYEGSVRVSQIQPIPSVSVKIND